MVGQNNHLSQAEVKKRKTVYTSREVLEQSIPHKSEPPAPEKCKYCGRALYYEAIVLMGTVVCWNRSNPQRCTCEKAVAYWQKRDAADEQKRIDEEIAKKRKKFNAKIERLLGKSGIKKRFASRTFESFEVNKQNQIAYNVAKKYADEFKIYASEGKGIYFEGTYGTGKTHLAVAISLKLIHEGIPVICKTSIDILADIKRSYESHSNVTEHEVLDVYKKVDLLIIDDLGKEQCTEWSMPIFYSIINDRYEQMKPTIITTNYNEEMLIERLTPKGCDNSNARAIISRLHECVDVVTMAWNDYRGGKSE